MTSSLVDSNVLIDLLSFNPTFAPWALKQMDLLSQAGGLVVNQICYAETATYFPEFAEFEKIMMGFGVVRDDLPWSAAGLAGAAFRAYRGRGGERQRVLPDFLIGAHAMVKGYQLLTRDARRYRTYFSDLDIIAPDTHP